MNNKNEVGGRWMTVHLTEEEFEKVDAVQKQWNSIGLKLPFTKILRRIVAEGFTQINWDRVEKDPMALFQKK